MTVIPGRPDSAELTELPEPEPKDGELLVEPAPARRLRHRPRDRRGRARRAAARPRAARARSRAARPREAGRGRLRGGPARGGHRPPARSRAVPLLRQGRVGHVPQRPVHRARHQGPRRLRRRARDASSRTSRSRSRTSSATSACSPSRRASSPRPGSRSTASPRARARCTSACSSPGAGPIGLLAALMGKQRDLEVHVLDRAEEGVKPDTRARRSAPSTTRATSRTSPKQCEPDIVVECTGVAELVAGAMQHTAPGAIVCLTGVAASRTPQPRRRRAQQRARARERRGVRVGERQPPALRAGGEGADGTPIGTGSAGSSPAPCRSSAGRRRSSAATTTSRSWSSSPAP